MVLSMDRFGHFNGREMTKRPGWSSAWSISEAWCLGRDARSSDGEMPRARCPKFRSRDASGEMPEVQIARCRSEAGRNLLIQDVGTGEMPYW